MRTALTCLLVIALCPLWVACGEAPSTKPAGAEEPPAPITNRIDVPSAVRRNLGITFVDVAYRHVARTRRVPGSFEFVPGAHRAYHATMEGQVEVLVEQYQKVAPGDVLFRIESPTWRALQLEMARIVNAIRASRARLATLGGRRQALVAHEEAVGKQRAVWEGRLEQLERQSAAGAGNRSAKTEARAELSSLRSVQAKLLEERTELDAEERTLAAELQGHAETTPLLFADAGGEAGGAHKGPDGRVHDLALSRAAVLLGVRVEDLRKNVGTAEAPRQSWRDIGFIEVKARSPGVIETLSLATGAWVDVGKVVVETLDLARIRFRAAGLQADLAVLRDGLPARVVPPGGKAASKSESVEGTLNVGIEADPLTRKIDLIIVPKPGDLPHWARSGVSTEAEITLIGTSEPRMAIPVSSVIRDGLERVIFRRDPKDPDKVIRLVADLGVTDGRWIVLQSGVVEGDQVVDHGIYELMLAGSSAKMEGGHFHADGTWHAGSDH